MPCSQLTSNLLLCTQHRSQTVQSFSCLTVSVSFFLDGTILDGCNPLIKFMKAGLSTLLKGCRSPTIYCTTRWSSCGWEMKKEPLYAVNGIWVEVEDLSWLSLDFLLACTYLERLAGCFSSMCLFRFAVDVTEVRIFFFKAGGQSLHRNVWFFPSSPTLSYNSFKWSYEYDASLLLCHLHAAVVAMMFLFWRSMRVVRHWWLCCQADRVFFLGWISNYIYNSKFVPAFIKQIL